MVDAHYSDPRLAIVYDAFDGPRDDLDHYESIVQGLGAHRVLDVGCGTGSLAVRLAGAGLDVVGVDPAEASLDVARGKVGADRVRWICGDATTLPPLDVDLAVMTGNVAQVFLTEGDLTSAFIGIRDALRPGGHVVFESRRPERRAWIDWAEDTAETRAEVEGAGRVRHRSEVTSVNLPLVSFRQTYAFEDGGQLLSDSTLRFHSADELAGSLRAAGFTLLDTRDAPDRPGRELVLVARRTERP